MFPCYCHAPCIPRNAIVRRLGLSLIAVCSDSSHPERQQKLTTCTTLRLPTNLTSPRNSPLPSSKNPSSTKTRQDNRKKPDRHSRTLAPGPRMH